METIRILLAGGIKHEKAGKVCAVLEEGLASRGYEAHTTFVNTYEVKRFSSYEPDHDMMVVAGTVKPDTSLPMVDGMALLYPWMGIDAVFDAVIETAGRVKNC